MYWEQSVQCEAETDIGLRRKNNEDAYSIHLCPNETVFRQSGHLVLVADGMGGHAVGELASRIAAETVPHTFLKSGIAEPRRSLAEAIQAANKAINSRGTQNADFLHMGTTCTALALTTHGAVIGHVGDSRAYRIRRDRVDQMTFDHSLEWEMERQHADLAGTIDLSQHKNVITRSLGPEAVIDVDIEGPFPVLPGDIFVLCSDGLSNQVTDSEMGAIARELPPKTAARLLIDLANIRGGPDNSTVLVVKIGEMPANVVPTLPEQVVDERQELGWSWLFAFAGVGMLLVFSLMMQYFGRPILGSLLFALSVTGLLAVVAASIRQKNRLRQAYRSEDTHTHLWRPHRTAVGLSSKDLADRLLATDQELLRSAKEDGWDVDWDAHDQSISAARQAVEERRYSRAVRDAAKAIRVIMEELPRRLTARNNAQSPT